jgi:hypothetical protein
MQAKRGLVIAVGGATLILGAPAPAAAASLMKAARNKEVLIEPAQWRRPCRYCPDGGHSSYYDPSYAYPRYAYYPFYAHSYPWYGLYVGRYYPRRFGHHRRW